MTLKFSKYLNPKSETSRRDVSKSLFKFCVKANDGRDIYADLIIACDGIN